MNTEKILFALIGPQTFDYVASGGYLDLRVRCGAGTERAILSAHRFDTGISIATRDPANVLGGVRDLAIIRSEFERVLRAEATRILAEHTVDEFEVSTMLGRTGFTTGWVQA